MQMMTPQAGRSKVKAAAAMAVVVVVCCVAVASGQEDTTDASTTTTTTDDKLTTHVIVDEDDSLQEKTTAAPENNGDTDKEATEAALTTITKEIITTTTTSTTTTTTVDEEGTTGTPSAPDITAQVVNTTAETTPAATTQSPPANITVTTTTEVTCGVNADLKEGECVCRPSWTHDPTNAESPCTCPDLCRTPGGLTCPSNSVCRQVSCSLATCACPGHLVYSASTSTCISPCQHYGDAVCGSGSGWRCVEEDEGRSFTCQCAEGYTPLEGECQDIDECVSESSSPCKSNEQCVNSDGSYECACKEGFFRVANGSCVNMNECLNPRLHNCDHVCRDAQPPIRYTCDCFPGHTWNNTLQRCLLDDPNTSCKCGPPERSVCFRASGGEEQCFPRPGYIRNGTTFIDASECGEAHNERAWCWARGECVEGVGGSECLCAKGFTNDPPHTADCVRVSCPEGTLLDGSTCVDPCSSLTCPLPFTCRSHGTAEPSCRCLSRCLSFLQPDSNFSVYHGSFLVHAVSKDFDTSHHVVKALEDYFGPDSAEVISITKINSTEFSASQQTNVSVEFALMTLQPNISHELPEALRSLCRHVEDKPGLCVLAGGLQLVKDSITTTTKDPCGDSPCPNEHNFVCSVKTNVSGRFFCDCASGFHKVDILNSLGYCKDVNECEGEKQPCSNHQDCINTPGGFTCRARLTSLGQNPEAVQEMAIAFGVLFFVALLTLIAVLCLLKKKHKATRELVPMTTGFDNSAYK